MHHPVEVHSATLIGIDAEPVVVRAVRHSNTRRLQVTGFPAPAAHELAVVVRLALEKAGVPATSMGFVCEVTPTPERTTGLALPLAIAIAAGLGLVPAGSLRQRRFYADLDCSGGVVVARGSVSVVELAARSHDVGAILAYDPAEPLSRGTLVATLAEVLDHLRGEPLPERSGGGRHRPAPRPYCLADIRGQEVAKRALEIAAAGGHHLAFIGPPGAGKTMLARRLPGLLPPLTDAERDELARIYSAAGLGAAGVERPFRAPHHTASAAALAGGGAGPWPGEVTLAHAGVLLLDELPEFSRTALAGITEALAGGRVHIGRADRTVVLPARFQLLGAMLPCPCGRSPCACTPEQIARYRARVPAAVVAAFDVVCRVAPVAYADASATAAACDSSATVAARVLAARGAQLARNRGKALNASLSAESPASDLALAPSALARAAALPEPLRARTLRVARTVADLVGSTAVSPDHLDDALTFTGGITA